ncbi:hypothetical protein [Microbispora sp. H10836]|uniref:hypothetical protein n=1 Tax=Microbispora sp. H10836 TaxID=2729106 RepID=UPI001472FD96|nr:hypothetical protein [Microbispora sp. H10836]
MPSDQALNHARQMLEELRADDSDPRLSRIDLIQIANYLARTAGSNDQLGSTLRRVHRWADGQRISNDAIINVIQRTGGSPRVRGIASGLGWPLAAMRLVGHWGVQHPTLIERFESTVNDSGPLGERVESVLHGTERDFFDALLSIIGDRVVDSPNARSQIIAAAKDCSSLFEGDEFPAASRLGPQLHPRSDWPPLRLGTRTIMGGRWDEDPHDWDGGGYGGGGQTICEINSAQSTEANIACGVVITVVVIVIIATKL